MQTQTDAQVAALARDNQRVVYCVKIDLTSDLLYCSGLESITISSTTYTPRGLAVSTINVTDPTRSSATVTIDDLDGTIAATWYSERFSGQTVTITEAIRDAGDWVAVQTIPWICTTAERRGDGAFVLSLSGAGGIKPRAGLEIASRSDWHLAPEPGAAVQVGHSATVIG
jgi:hypothetical protein